MPGKSSSAKRRCNDVRTAGAKRMRVEGMRRSDAREGLRRIDARHSMTFSFLVVSPRVTKWPRSSIVQQS
jgi:hypothetical protein